LTATGWPADVDPAKTVLLEKNTLARPPSSFEGAAARGWSAIPTRKLSSRSMRPPAHAAANDVWDPWWRVTIDASRPNCCAPM